MTIDYCMSVCLSTSRHKFRKKLRRLFVKAINFKTPFGTFNSSDIFVVTDLIERKVRSEIGSHLCFSIAKYPRVVDTVQNWSNFLCN